MMRSALEWLISRSCQSATFSNATTAFPRHTRARPLNRALVRHRRATFLAFTEEFFYFENFCTLEMTKLCCPTVNTGGDHGERGDEFRVTVALYDLG